MIIRTDADLAAILDEPRSYLMKGGQKYYDRLEVLGLMGRVAETMMLAGWQPIETAPRDGTDILLGCATWARPELGQWSVATAYWSTDGGSYEDGEVARTSDEVDSPTHWRPLPCNPLT